MRLQLSILVCALACLPLSAVAAVEEQVCPATTAEALAAGMAARYRPHADFAADFTQVYLSASIPSRKSPVNGRVLFRRPDKLRWEYGPPEEKLFVTDGRTVWYWEKGPNQVTVSRDAASSEMFSALAFIWGGGDLRQRFTLGCLVDAGSDAPILTVAPRRPAEYQKIYLVLDKASYGVREAVVFDPIGNASRIVFAGERFDRVADDSLFTFVPPPGAIVQELK